MDSRQMFLVRVNMAERREGGGCGTPSLPANEAPNVVGQLETLLLANIVVSVEDTPESKL